MFCMLFIPPILVCYSTGNKECVAVLTMLYKKKWCSFMCWIWFPLWLGTLSCQNLACSDPICTQNLQTACTMECRRVVVIPGCTVGLNLVMGKFQWKLQHILKCKYFLQLTRSLRDSDSSLMHYSIYAPSSFLFPAGIFPQAVIIAGWQDPKQRLIKEF